MFEAGGEPLEPHAWIDEDHDGPQLQHAVHECEEAGAGWNEHRHAVARLDAQSGQAAGDAGGLLNQAGSCPGFGDTASGVECEDGGFARGGRLTDHGGQPPGYIFRIF